MAESEPSTAELFSIADDVNSSACCKTKCPDKPTCPPKDPFIYSKKFWILCLIINILIILIRSTTLSTELEAGDSVLMFYVWLELQIITFYILIISFIEWKKRIYHYYINIRFFNALRNGNRITNPVM